MKALPRDDVVERAKGELHDHLGDVVGRVHITGPCKIRGEAKLKAA